MTDKKPELSAAMKKKVEPKVFKKNPIIGTKFTIAISSANGLGVGFVSYAEIGQDPRLINLDIDTGKAEMTETLMYLTARKEVPVIRAFLKAAEKP